MNGGYASSMASMPMQQIDFRRAQIYGPGGTLLDSSEWTVPGVGRKLIPEEIAAIAQQFGIKDQKELRQNPTMGYAAQMY